MSRYFWLDKCGVYHSNWFTLLITPNWHRRLTYFLKTASCTLGTGYGFAWYDLTSGCSPIYTVLTDVTRVPFNSKSYLVGILCGVLHSSSVKVLLFDATVYMLNYCIGHIILDVYTVWRPLCVLSPIILCYKRFIMKPYRWRIYSTIIHVFHWGSIPLVRA